MCRSTGELAASTCAKRVKSRGEAGLLRMATAIRGMPGSEFEPRRPLQKEYPIRQDGVFFLECAAAPENSLPRPARSASNQEVRQGSCEWRQPFVGCREASSSLVARSKNTTQRVVFFFAYSALTAVSGRHKITSQNHSAGGPPLHRQFPLFLEGFCVDITRWKSLWKLCKTQ